MTVERFPVEEGTIMLFARAVGDPNPAFADPDQAGGSELGGIIAPPTYVQSSAQWDPEYALRPKIGAPWLGSGRTPSGVPRQGSGGGTGLHAEQHFEYRRPLRPGDVLSLTTRPGRSWEKEGRSGRLRFTETTTEYRDQHGDVVVVARSVGVMTEGPVDRKDGE